MNNIYIIKDKNNYPVAGAYNETNAVEYCKEYPGHTYTLVPFLHPGVRIELYLEENIYEEPIIK